LKTGVLPKAIYEEMRSLYQIQVAKAEKVLRDLYNQSDPSRLDAVRRRLLLAAKGALSDALRKQIISEAVVKERLRQIDEKLLSLGDD